MRLVGESGPVASLNTPLRQGAIGFGSAQGNAIVIPGAAARHARLRRVGRAWLIEDLAGSSGTFLNGIRVIGRQALRPGDIIGICDAEMLLLAEPQEESQPQERPTNRKAWLGVSSFLFLALAALVVVMARVPEATAPLAAGATQLALDVPVAPAPEPSAASSAAVVLATFTPTATLTATATRTPTAPPSPTATATVAPPVAAEQATLRALLASVPGDRAAAAMTAVAWLGASERQAAFATAAAAGETIGTWVDELLGTATPEPPAGRLAFGRYLGETDRYDVVVRELATGMETTLLAYASQPSFSLDGLTLAYHSWQSDALGLFAATADGSQRWLLTREGHPEDGRPSWSPDGRIVTFSSLRYGDGRSRIYVVPAVGGLATGVCIGEYVDWSPDGALIAFKGCIGGSCGIMLATPDGSEQRLLTSDASDGAPAWSPDGQFIAFHSSRDGTWDIYVVRADGTEGRRLTVTDTIETLPTWSPDGRYLAFRSNRGDEWGIWAAPLAGGGETRLFAANVRPGDEMVETFAWLP